jgi:hypothetical protein
MLLGVPVSDPPANLVQKIDAWLFGQMSEIADEIGDGMLITRSTTLKDRYCGGSPAARSRISSMLSLPIWSISGTNFSGYRSSSIE